MVPSRSGFISSYILVPSITGCPSMEVSRYELSLFFRRQTKPCMSIVITKIFITAKNKQSCNERVGVSDNVLLIEYKPPLLPIKRGKR